MKMIYLFKKKQMILTNLQTIFNFVHLITSNPNQNNKKIHIRFRNFNSFFKHNRKIAKNRVNIKKIKKLSKSIIKIHQRTCLIIIINRSVKVLKKRRFNKIQNFIKTVICRIILCLSLSKTMESRTFSPFPNKYPNNIQNLLKNILILRASLQVIQ